MSSDGYPIREKPAILYCEEINALVLYHSTDREFLWEICEINDDFKRVQVACAFWMQRPEEIYNWVFVGEL